MRVLWTSMLLALVAMPAEGQDSATIRLTLPGVLARADSASEAVGIARAGLRQAEAGVRRAVSARLPQLSGSATYTRTLASQFSGSFSESKNDSFPAPVNCDHYSPHPELPIAQRLDSLEHGLDCAANSSPFDFSKLPFGQANTWNLGLQASQSLFNHAVTGQIRAARATRDAAAAQVKAQKAQALLDAAQAYFDAQLAERLLAIADSALAQAERSYADTKLAHDVGNAADFDLLRAGVQRDNQRPVVIQRRQQRDLAMLHLRQLLDLPPDRAIELVTPLDDSVALAQDAPGPGVAGSSDTTVADRAPVRAAEASLAASEGELTAANGSRLPSLTVSSAFAEIAFPERVFSIKRFVRDWNVNVRLDVPIFTGGRLRADVQAAEAARDEAALRLRQAREAAARETVDSRLQLAAAQSAWEASRGTAEQASRAYAIAELRYRNGLSTLTELSDSRLLLAQAEANRAQAARDLRLARMRSALLPDLPFGAGSAAPGSF